MKFVLLSILHVMIFCVGSYGISLPPGINKCKLSDSSVNACLKEQAQRFIPFLAMGLPEYGIPQLDPTFVPDVDNLKQKFESSTYLRFSFKNITSYGFSSTKINDFILDQNTKTITISTTHSGHMVSDYVLSGNLLLIPVEGEGISNYTSTDMHHKYKLHYDTVKGNDNTIYWKIVNYSVRYQPTKMEYQFSNLFNGNEQLSALVHSFANSNWKVLFDEVAAPFMEPIINATVNIIGKILASTPLEDLFDM